MTELASRGGAELASRGGAELAVRGIRKKYGRLSALDGVDLTAKPGGLLAVLGPSGCGKSTLLKVIAGLIPADSGEVSLDGRRLDHKPSCERGLGFLFQNYALFPHLTVAENVAFGLMIRGASRAERNRRAEELLNMVGLTAHARKLPRMLSGGEQQRVALARALAPRPRVLLLDEPLSALDVQIRRHLRKEIATLQKSIGVTTLLVTHDQEEAFELGDRIAVMRAGRLAQVGTPQEIYETPASEFVARFVGLVNVLAGTGDGPVVHVGRWPLTPVGSTLAPGAAATSTPNSRPNPDGQSRRLTVRPEDVELLGPPSVLTGLAETGGAVSQNLLSCRVVTSLYLGTHLRVTLVTEDGQMLTAEVSKGQAEAIGLVAGSELIAHLKGVREMAPDDAGSLGLPSFGLDPTASAGGGQAGLSGRSTSGETDSPGGTGAEGFPGPGAGI